MPEPERLGEESDELAAGRLHLREVLGARSLLQTHRCERYKRPSVIKYHNLLSIFAQPLPGQHEHCCNGYRRRSAFGRVSRNESEGSESGSEYDANGGNQEQEEEDDGEPGTKAPSTGQVKNDKKPKTQTRRVAEGKLQEQRQEMDQAKSFSIVAAAQVALNGLTPNRTPSHFGLACMPL
ncbi:hypothetical protein FIBSPDRAFT_883720 [Athelia psychrophila]|uniref:Uncharacterized protein n=1 Tax=Athelia psychrophila TaxID=1759441 RepID=A0A166TV59_9AGAM|nr:hypothetical protein FIBSPDRAFT_883720 [Fibularhizoctonia sp. CBS 109695]